MSKTMSQPAVKNNAAPSYRKINRVRVPIRDLNFDYEYQRAPDKPLISTIERDWNEIALGTIVVNRREDGTYWVIDGQQRTLGTLARHDPAYEMICELHEGLSFEEEVRLFDYLNSWRKPVPLSVKMHGRYLAGRPDTVAIVEALEELELPYAWNGGQFAGFCCWSTLHRVHEQYGLAHLKKVLTVISQAWPKEGDAMASVFVTGLATFLHRHGDHAPLNEIIKRLSRTTSETILKNADASRTRNRSSRSYPTAVYRELIEAHDWRLIRDEKRINPRGE